MANSDSVLFMLEISTVKNLVPLNLSEFFLSFYIFLYTFFYKGIVK
jgi:hypothetical protein